MKINDNHDIIQEVLQALKEPEKYGSTFFKKYASNKEVMALYNECRKYKESELYHNATSLDIDEEWHKLQPKLKKSKLKHLIIGWSIAAAILIAAIIVVPNHTLQLNKNTIAQTNINLGQENAILITSSGEKIALNKYDAEIVKDVVDVHVTSGKQNILTYNKLENNKLINLKNRYNTLKIPRFGTYQLILSDGTRVKLNAESQLRYPIQFSGNTREVELIGEAFFEVAKNKQKPFIVKTNNLKTKVLGTQFNVSAYPKSDINITLVEGKIQVNTKNNSKILHPNQNACLSNNNLTVENVNVKQYVSWRNGYLYFEKDRLEDILKKLELWYDFKVEYKQEKIKNYLFKMRADKKQPFSKIIKRLEETGRIKIKVIDRGIIINDR